MSQNRGDMIKFFVCVVGGFIGLAIVAVVTG